MSALPDKHQSIRPPRWFLLAIVAMLVVMGVVWSTVTVAVRSGGEDCASKGETVTTARCR